MFPEQVSSINTLGGIFVACMALLILLLPRRRFALLPIAAATCYMTFGQQIIVAGLHFTILRVLVLLAFSKFVITNRGHLQWLRIDTVFLCWVASSVVTYTVLWHTSEALINRLGLAYDAIGFYFVFRYLIRDLEDIKRCCTVFALVLAPLAICMMVEKSTGRNPFYVLGGVPEFTQIREGVLRCQGPFGHPILAGTFGAVWLPLFIGLFAQGKRHRAVATVGIISSTIITLMSGSSGPVAAYIAGFIGICFWPMRRFMRRVRWAMVIAMGLLQLMMKAPIWFIFAHVNMFSGSTGWHRANLIDQTVRHFFDWWLVGTRGTLGWGVWAGDITNFFISQAVRGGLTTFVLFICLIICGYSGLGAGLKRARMDSKRREFMLWALGASLLAHIASFLSVSYFDQNIVNWYLLLAALGMAITLYPRGKRRASQPSTASPLPLPVKELQLNTTNVLLA
jgi:hypothetical protein